MWEEGDKLKKELLRNIELELEDLENTQPIHITKKEKAFSGETTQGVTERLFAKEIMGMWFMDPISHLNRS